MSIFWGCWHFVLIFISFVCVVEESYFSMSIKTFTKRSSFSCFELFDSFAQKKRKWGKLKSLMCIEYSAILCVCSQQKLRFFFEKKLIIHEIAVFMLITLQKLLFVDDTYYLHSAKKFRFSKISLRSISHDILLFSACKLQHTAFVWNVGETNE